MKIAVGSDHAGFIYKEKIKQFLSALGHEVTDFGTDSEEPVDYPLFIRPVAEAVARGDAECGVVLGGSGNGEAMTANRPYRVAQSVEYALDELRTNVGIQFDAAVVAAAEAYLVRELRGRARPAGLTVALA